MFVEKVTVEVVTTPPEPPPPPADWLDAAPAPPPPPTTNTNALEIGAELETVIVMTLLLAAVQLPLVTTAR